jgi:hypothetical protein
MRRLILRFVFAAVCFAAGWLVATAGVWPGGTGVFRLSIDAPTGDTRIKCEGCEFFTWSEGRSGPRLHVLDIACAEGPCWKVVGAILNTKPMLLARSETHD